MLKKHSFKLTSIALFVSLIAAPMVNAGTAGLSGRVDVKKLAADVKVVPNTANLSGRMAVKKLNVEVDRAAYAEVDGEIDNLRESIILDAVDAVVETNNALIALENNQTEVALASIKTAIGKLAVTLKREPDLGLKPIHVRKTIHDLKADPAIIKENIAMAEKHLKAGELQHARMLISPLVSDITVTTTSIPLSTYPDSLKAVVPLIDDGEIAEAKGALQTLLNTLITKDLIVPLPPLRAELALQEAETLVINENRTEEENQRLQELLTLAHDDLTLSELLGYGNKERFKAMHDLISEIENDIADGKGGTGWFDTIKQQWSDLFNVN